MLSSSSKLTLAIAVFTILAAQSPTFAGEHYEEKDSFSGSIATAFAMTKSEESRAGFFLTLDNYDLDSKSININITAPFGVECGDRGLEIKLKDGAIQRVPALEGKMQYCFATIPIEWTKDRFSVRVPMRVRSPLVGTIDTKSLKPERYKKTKDSSASRN